MLFLVRRRIAKLEKQIEKAQANHVYYRQQWIDCGREAYYMDMMATPMKWGRKQAESNSAGAWADHYRKVRDKLEKELTDQQAILSATGVPA